MFNNEINEQVLSDLISSKIQSRMVVAPFARIDETLLGTPGDSIKVPQYTYIGDATAVAEGDEVSPSDLQASTTTVTVSKALKAVEITDEALITGYGNPVGEAAAQISKSIAAKLDSDALNVLLTATVKFDGTDNKIDYAGIVSALGMFNEEVNTEKVMFIHPEQMTDLRKDADFISADKYMGNVMLTGEIGMIANTRIVVSNKVKKDEENGTFTNPIVQLQVLDEAEAPAVTVYLKRDTNVEVTRQALKRATDISVDKFYAVALSNDSKVVLAQFKA
ncbi:MAG: N4-gp56 family major capsid protein [Clostridia bacterium]|nr:N4-gp56 family major capsid protein [Clostridia bacterium]